MREEHKIILSMYYANPDNNLDLFDIRYTKAMDLEQLLLMMKEIFGEGYQPCLKNGVLTLCPTSEYVTEYDNIIGKENFLYRIINIQNNKFVKFNKSDYSVIRQLKYANCSVDRLYFLNILLESVNGTNTVSARPTRLYYVLFGQAVHLEDIVLLIKYLVYSYVSKGEQGILEVCAAMQSDYNLLHQLYAKREEILTDLHQRNILQREYYNNFFINESLTARSWIEEKSGKSSEDVIDFAYGKNVCVCLIMRKLLYHVIKICQILSDSKFVLDEPFKLLKPGRKKQDLDVLDGLLDELEKSVQDGKADCIQWFEKYMSAVNNICG